MIGNNLKGRKTKVYTSVFNMVGAELQLQQWKKIIFIAASFHSWCGVLCVVEIPLGHLMN
jgi:hypothetical protein